MRTGNIGDLSATTGIEMSNYSVEQPSLSLLAVYSIAEVLVGALACSGNALVCWVFLRTPSLHTPTNSFVTSQAAADTAVGCLAVPFSVAVGLGVRLDWHSCRMVSVFILLLTQTSIFSLLAVSVDRLLYIKVPLRYPDLLRPSRVKITIVALWVFSFLVVLLTYLLWPTHLSNCWRDSIGDAVNGSTATLHMRRHKAFTPGKPSLGNGRGNVMSMRQLVAVPQSSLHCWKGKARCVFEEVTDMRFMVYCNFMCCVLPPLLLMTCLYGQIFCVASQHLHRLSREQGHSLPSLLTRELHMLRSLVVAVVAFSVCWLPLHLRNSLVVFYPNFLPPPWVTLATIALSHANSALNPLLYVLKLQEFRRAVQMTLRRPSSSVVTGTSVQ